ncbi:MAG: class I SAM-dependent methyltransferase [Sphingobium sp.]|nr:class I SAM-dependent methyltransferase [Sphingobium sp.]
MTVQHQQQVKDWNGESGERWVVHQLWLDQMLGAFGAAAIDAAQPAVGETILDIGCGAGTTSFALAERVAEGHVTGVDISAQLIERAKERAGDQSNVRFLLADASNADVPPAQFDLLYSRFGVMFFDDAAGAFTHLRRALKPSGRLAFICWRGANENDWVRLPMKAIKGLIPPVVPLPADAPGPFSFGDKGRVQKILEDAGFVDVTFTPFDHDIIYGRGETNEAAIEDALAMAFELGPLSRALASESEEVRERACDAVRAAYAQQVQDGRVTINGAAWIVTALNPAD